MPNVCSNQIDQRFDCLSATLEMPFKELWGNAKAETGALATMSGGGPGGRGAPPPAWPHDQAPLHAQLPRELLGPLLPRPVVVHPQAHLVEPLAAPGPWRGATGTRLAGSRPAGPWPGTRPWR